AQHLIVGEVALVATTAIVIGARQADLAMHGQQPPALVGMELGGMLAQQAGDAGAYVALFFRLAKLACRTSLASFCPASRNLKSMVPNSWASGTSTARSTIWRKVCSILG